MISALLFESKRVYCSPLNMIHLPGVLSASNLLIACWLDHHA